MKRPFSKTRITLIVSLLILLVLNIYLRQRPYIELENYLEEIQPKLKSNEAKNVADLMNEEIVEVLELKLNSSSKNEFVKELNIKRFPGMKTPFNKFLDKHKVTEEKDRIVLSEYVAKILDCYHGTLCTYINIETDSYDRNFIERYYYFDF